VIRPLGRIEGRAVLRETRVFLRILTARKQAPVITQSLRSFRLSFAVLGALAAGCGDDPSQPRATGRLTVVVKGLPTGATAAAQVTGPGNYGQLVPQTRTFAELTPGPYVVMAFAVTEGATTYQPVPTTQTVDVVANVTQTATVTYSP
jgi:hypothetical protein